MMLLPAADGSFAADTVLRSVKADLQGLLVLKGNVIRITQHHIIVLPEDHDPL